MPPAEQAEFRGQSYFQRVVQINMGLNVLRQTKAADSGTSSSGNPSLPPSDVR